MNTFNTDDRARGVKSWSMTVKFRKRNIRHGNSAVELRLRRRGRWLLLHSVIPSEVEGPAFCQGSSWTAGAGGFLAESIDDASKQQVFRSAQDENVGMPRLGTGAQVVETQLATSPQKGQRLPPSNLNAQTKNSTPW
jgi:hypothetical protein